MKFSIFKDKVINAIAFRVNRVSGVFRLQNFVKLNGKQFKIPVSNGFGEVNVRLKEEWFLKLLKSLNIPNDAHFLDIGVNVGQSLLAFRSCYSNTYWGFEPNPACVAYLNTLIKANNFQNVHIVPVGLSSADALVMLYASSERDSSATIVAELKGSRFAPQQTKYVPVFNFEHLQLHIPIIALIKIDVEGAELDVISGMQETLRKQQPIIICEVLDYNAEESRDLEQSRASKLSAIMKGLNYKIYRIVCTGRDRITLEQLSTIELKKWVPESLQQNDYLFLPEHIPSFAVQSNF